MHPRAFLTLGPLVGFSLLAGCTEPAVVVAPPPPTMVAPATTGVAVVAVPADPAVAYLKEPPPPPRFEEIPPKPSAEYVWLPGYWALHAGQLQWIAGHYDVPPRPGAHWVTSKWERQGDGYVFIQGAWQ